MTQAKHTQGPWFRDVTNGQMGITDKNGADVVGGCSCCGSPFGVNEHDEAEANAVLIAAAPDLLEALELCRFALEPYDDVKPRDWITDRENLRDAHEVARAAIAKATGETK